MTFAEAEQQLLMLRERRRLGQLPDAEYVEAVNALRVIDEEQAWWQPDPYSEGWLRWDGAAWQPATPPAQPEPETTTIVEDLATAQMPATVADTAQVEAPVAEGAAPKQGFSEWAAGVQQQVQAQASDPQTFLRLARTLPLRRRPESWWNALSIFGGAISGYFWFVYGSVSGLPTPAFLANGPLGDYSKFLMPLVLLLIPILLLVFRRRAAGLLTGIQRKFGGFSLTKKIVLIIGIPVLLYYFPSAYTKILAILTRVPFLSRLSFLQLGFSEGVDFITPLMMVGLPIAFIYLRRPIDGFLARIKLYIIPTPLRIGIGIAMPFLTAYLLYNMADITQYSLLRANVLLGTALSYMMVRTPRLMTPAGKTPLPTPALTSMLMCLGMAVLVLLLADPALAHCFLTDPFNFKDGLRTDGVAPILAGVATATVSMLVNGVEIARTVIQDTRPVEEGEDPEHRNYEVQVRTIDAQGKPSTTVREGDQGVIYLYAFCMNESGPFPDGDATINFPPDLGAPGLAVADLGMQYQQRCACISMPSPVQGGIPPTITVTVTAGNGQFSIPVTLQVDVALVLTAKMINADLTRAVQRAFPVYDAWTPKDEDTWTFTELVAFFHTPKNPEDPTPPGFTPIWEAPVISPDYIDLTPLASDDGNLTWRCRAKMKEGVKVPEDWLLNDGVITVTFTGKPEAVPGAPPSSTSYTAKFGLHLPPMVELAYRFETPKDETRDYQDIELQPGEFVADGEDVIGIIFFVKSLLDDEPDKVAAGIDLKSIKFELSREMSRHYEMEPDPDFKESGQLRYTIKSKTPVLYTRSVKLPLTFKATGEYTPASEKAKTPIRETVDVTVNPCPLYLKLWVVPGKKRGTSEAGAIAGARLPRAPWFGGIDGLQLELAASSAGGGPELTLQDTPVKTIDKNGEARWVLGYSGLTFDNIGSAEFRVKCRIGSGDQATVFPISVGRNLLDFLSDIEANAGSLNLTNPEFQHTSALGNAADYLWPDSTLGILYNFRSMVAEKIGYSAPPEWNHYVCGALARRLLHWALERRYGYGRYTFDTSLKMNGIELGEYTFNHLHDFFGFNLSGNDPWKEAKFIDPWWNQTYDNQVVLSLNEERVKLVASITFLISAGALVALFVGKALGALCLRFAPSIISLFRTYIYAKIQNIAFNPRHTVGVFSILAIIGTAFFWPTLWADAGVFDDDDLIGYGKYQSKWLATQREAHCSAHGSGLPPVEPLESW